MLHRLDDGTYVISTRHMWLPGAYVDERAARYAFRVPLEALYRLEREVCHKGLAITFEQLRAARKVVP